MTRQGLKARGCETGVAQEGAGGTHRALMSSDERDRRGNSRRKRKKNTKAREPEGTGPPGGGGSRGPTKAQSYTWSRAEKRHADDLH